MKIARLVIALMAVCALGACVSNARTAVVVNEGDAQDALKDTSFSAAVQSGKAIVVMSNLRLEEKYPLARSIEDNNASTSNYRTDLSAYVEWSNHRNENLTLTSGHTARFEGMKDSGPLLDMVAGASNYQIFVVEPGVYELGALGYILPRKSPPAAQAQSVTKVKKIGTVVFLPVTTTVMTVTKQWQEAVYGTRTQSYEECAAIHVTGGCVEIRHGTRRVEYVITPAGEYDKRTPMAVPGVRLRMDLVQPFASFSVGAGEVILVDGLYAEAANLRYDDKSCKGKVGEAVACALMQVSLKQSPASVDALKTVPFTKNGYPKLAQLMTKIQPRAVEIKAFKSSTKRDGHQEFSMSVE